MKIWADFHTHTRYSHGSGTIRDNVEAAVKKGLRVIGISDHGPATIGVGPDLDDFKKMREEIESLKEEYKNITILLGCEANVISLDGRLDMPERVLDELDYVMVGLHPLVWTKTFKDGYRILFENFVARYLDQIKPKVLEQNTRALINAIKNYRVDIITHPGLHLPIDTGALAEAAASCRTAMEINAGHGYMTEEYVKIAKSYGVKFAIGSDAHSPKKVGELKRGIEIALEAGLSELDILNAGRNQEVSLWRKISSL
ncbi:PHP domain-containing protein [Thermosediminibacter oceani]|uniref:Histidinol phosphate phosphatase HisJ family n=1 Tax=Thermosediminibacter oceani (strain ATCC BAA-1034 / DSM 16646 / JW/IW-1228P) TaxID=555079 RepID=D9S2J7_THEOJ|nr:PHP domain-containing protein [Thermosediminibacter oceani]ADL07624.1 histidinol phosphate phosphatase HisJ family [Thermosediminibacter oceani DSM 16646]